MKGEKKRMKIGDPSGFHLPQDFYDLSTFGPDHRFQ